MDRLQTIQAFVTVAELHGFAPAARKLGVSPSAVTRSVAALEARLGIRLLQRTTRSVALTDAGARYFERARRIVLDVDEAESAAQAERVEPMGRFVVSAPLVFGRLHVAKVMCAYLARHRGVTGELMLADRLVNLVDEGVDLAVRIGQLEDASMVVRRVGETRRVIVASPGYFAGRKRPRTPGDLEGHDVVQCTSTQPVPEWSFETPHGRVQVPFVPHFATNSVDAALGHVSLGFGMTMVLAYQVEALVDAGTLEVVLPEIEMPLLPIQLVYATRRHLSANVRAFVEQVTTTCAWSFADLGSGARQKAPRRSGSR
ncbi:MAG: LysR family transcriptional regulator [Deltaproteobacteria bacterium]|nr:LysR family transcriptional regulator [Deltaproteobacteria bacterium]